MKKGLYILTVALALLLGTLIGVVFRLESGTSDIPDTSETFSGTTAPGETSQPDQNANWDLPEF